jgi:hypothetical protein
LASDIHPQDLDTDWDDEKREESIKLLYNFTCGTTKEAIEWYWRKKRVGRLGRALRLFAILLTTAGGMVPILRSAGIGTSNNPTFFGLLPEYGYVLVAVAAGLIALDRFFGFSSTWIRFVTTATTLHTGFTKFQLDWALLKARIGARKLTTEDCETLIHRLLGLLTFVREEVEKETAAWTTEYLSNLANLEKEAKKQIESQTPGGIDITFDNGDQA